MKTFSHRQIRFMLQSGEKLTQLEQRIISRHLSHCDACHNYAQTIQSFSAELASLFEAPSLPTHKRRNLVSLTLEESAHKKSGGAGWHFWAGGLLRAAALALLVGVFYFTVSHLIPEPATNNGINLEQTFNLIRFERPTEPGEQVLYTANIDCAGGNEELVADWQYVEVNEQKNLQIIEIKIINHDLRIAQKLWQQSSLSPLIGYYLTPQLIEIDRCDFAVVIQEIETGNRGGRLKVFHWSNGEMIEVLNTQGWLRGYGSDYFTSQQGRCTVAIESFAWDGEEFVLIGRKIKTIRCQIEE